MSQTPCFRFVGLCCLLVWGVFSSPTARAEAPTPPGTFTVQNGQAPWSDRVGQWALADVPTKFAGTTPLPQQSCSSRSLVVPTGAVSLLVGVSERDKAAFAAAYPDASLMTDGFSIQAPSGQRMNYVLFDMAKPPPILKGRFQAGLILFGVNAPGGDLAPPKKTAPDSDGNATSAATATTFTVQNGQAPWSDRVGQWALAEVPAKFASDTPLLQQKCAARALVVPTGATSVVAGVSDKDVAAFMKAYPQALRLPEVFSIQAPSGQTIVYSLLYVASPPPLLQGPFQAGLILFALNTPAPKPGSILPAPKAAVTYEPTPLVVPADKQKFEIYLLIGQSNMLGRDTSKLADQTDNPRIGSMDGNGKWFVGHDPLWSGSGTGPGLSFARALLADCPPDVKIGLVQCAVGGTPLSRWEKGADLYERALARARLAMQVGTLKGVLWHQGESDCTPKSAATYGAHLAWMLGDLRADLGMPDLPVVVGQLGMYLDAGSFPSVETIRAAIVRTATTIPHTALADSAGLLDKGDHLHFTADSQIEFGQRYAQAMRKLLSSE